VRPLPALDRIDPPPVQRDVDPPDADRTAPDRPARRRRGAWRAWLGVAISVAFLLIAFRGQDFGEIGGALERVDYAWLAPALACYFAGVWVRAVRWSVLLRPIVAVGPRAVFPVVIAGYTANNVLPLRGGEVVRAYLLGRRYGVRKTAALATIAVERLFDGLTMLAFMLVAAASISFTVELRRLALVAFAIFALVLVGLVGLVAERGPRERLMRLALGPLPAGVAARVERVTSSFLSGLGVLTRRRDLALVAATSLLAWGFEASMYWTIARGFAGPLADAFGPAAALLTTGVANLATLVPASPGYVGTFEAGVALAVNGALGVPRGLALSFAIVVHAALWLPVTLLGAVAWWRQHLSLADVRDEAPAIAPPMDAASSEVVARRRMTGRARGGSAPR